MMNPRNLRLIRIVLVTACLIQPGCAGFYAPKPDLTRYYILASLSEMGEIPTALSSQPGLSNVSLGLGPITLPRYLDRQRIVTRVSPNRIDVLELSRWAEPLQANVYRVLNQNFASILGTKSITLFPFGGPNPDYTVQIDVGRFDVAPDHSAVLAARWCIRDGNTGQILVSRDTTVTQPARAGSVSGSVTALSEALGELSNQVASAIRQVHAKAPPQPPRNP